MGKQQLKQSQGQNLSPQQIQFLGLLQTPIVSLEKRIEKELEENPALEEKVEDIDEEESQNIQYIASKKSNFEDLQIEESSGGLTEYLEKQLVGLNFEEDILFLVNYLINSLDDNGFLNRDLYSISSDLLTNNNLVVSEKMLQFSLEKLQNLEPIGVGAKDLQNCLLLQLKKKYASEEIAIKIISEYYNAFSNKNFDLIISELNISEKKLKSIYTLIESLNPIPSSGFSKNTSSTKYIYPDFTIIPTNNNELDLQMNKGDTKKIQVSKYYSNLLSETNDLTTKEFLTKKLEKAKWFQEAIEKRNVTLRQVMLVIIQLQKNYLTSGLEEDLKPMRLADVSDIVNMDISTISRVSNSKFIETHFGTFKVKELFSDAYRKDNGVVISTKIIKNQLEFIINSEDKKNPHTDKKLADLLGQEEYHIARRTVAKYREQLGIGTAKLRKEL